MIGIGTVLVLHPVKYKVEEIILTIKVYGMDHPRHQLPDGKAVNIVSRAERRTDIRTYRSAQVLVKVLECIQDTNLVGSTFKCTALNSSLSGIKIESSEEIPSGSRLDMWLYAESESDKLNLKGSVLWINQMSKNNDVYHLGLHIHASN